MQGIHCTDWDISESIPGRVPEKRFYQESKGCIFANLWQQPRLFLLFYVDIITGKDKKYYPFRYKKCAEFFEEEPSVFSHSKVIAIDENTSVCFYYTEERETVKIYALICTHK